MDIKISSKINIVGIIGTIVYAHKYCLKWKIILKNNIDIIYIYVYNNIFQNVNESQIFTWENIKFN